jgi:hypothetical protein
MVTIERDAIWYRKLRLLQWRFSLSDAEMETFTLQIAKIDQLETLLQLVDRLLTLQTPGEFEQVLLTYLPDPDKQP